jgi:hypothetical protein
MTLFISKKNQELLWRVFNKNESILNMDLEFKISWFKQTMSVYYDKYEKEKIDIKDLLKINKEFVEHIKKDLLFMNDIKKKQEEEILKQQELEEKQLLEQQQVIQNNNIYNSNDLLMMDNKKDELNADLIKKQEEFNNLINKKPPDDIDFTEKDNEEGTIKNMDELLRERQEARDNVDKETHIMYDKYVTANNLLEQEKKEEKEEEKKEEKDNIEVIEPS